MKKRDRIQNLESFEEFREKFMKSEIFKEMLAEMSVRERLEGLSFEQVVEALMPEQRLALAEVLMSERFAALLVMPDEALRQLPEAFVDTLPESIRAEIRRRLAL